MVRLVAITPWTKVPPRLETWADKNLPSGTYAVWYDITVDGFRYVPVDMKDAAIWPGVK